MARESGKHLMSIHAGGRECHDWRRFSVAGTPASFFIVGRDLRLAEKRDAASELLRQDFELGNHSFSHTIGLTRRSFGYLLKEISSTQRALRALGTDCIGFRSPGYDVDARVLRAARQCGCPL
jgi:peptidoglycan/xylan/chitin deacetylase (PgdA/CDA1 family)